MDTLQDIKTNDWQMSVAAPGAIVQGVDDINQCLLTIVSTQKGSAALRPDFGVDLLSWIDRPTSIAAPGLVAEMIDQIGLYEPRIDLQAIAYQVQDAKLVFSLTWFYKSGYEDGVIGDKPNTTLVLLADDKGFVLLDNNNVALIVS